MDVSFTGKRPKQRHKHAVYCSAQRPRARPSSMTPPPGDMSLRACVSTAGGGRLLRAERMWDKPGRKNRLEDGWMEICLWDWYVSMRVVGDYVHAAATNTLLCPPAPLSCCSSLSQLLCPHALSLCPFAPLSLCSSLSQLLCPPALSLCSSAALSLCSPLSPSFSVPLLLSDLSSTASLAKVAKDEGGTQVN